VYKGPSSSRRLSQKEPRNPNLIPIMNLFIVVIPMLMTIMVSIHISMIGINLSSSRGGGNEQPEEEPPKKITLALIPDRFEIQVEGQKDVAKIPVIPADSISSETGVKYDFITLDKKISELKKEIEKQNTIVVLPYPGVKFDILLRAIDICKANGFPNIKYLTVTKKFYRVQGK